MATTPLPREKVEREKTPFENWANGAGYDIAHTYDTSGLRWLWLNPMTADLWGAWLARAALAQPDGGEVNATKRQTMPSETRYTVAVEGAAQSYWDNIHDAITAGQRAVYAGPDATIRALDDLKAGRIAEWSYGFSAVRIYPPQPAQAMPADSKPAAYRWYEGKFGGHYEYDEQPNALRSCEALYTADGLASLLQRAYRTIDTLMNGLLWYRDRYPEADSGADDEAFDEAEETLRLIDAA